MNIYTEPGTQVVFQYSDAGYEHDIKRAAMYLVVGETYTIEKIVVGDWHTDIYLKEVPGVRFNSVQFEDEFQVDDGI